MSFTAEPLTGAPATIRSILDQAKAPVSLPALVRPSKLPKEALQQALATEEGRNGIYRWPGTRSPRFWSREPAEFVRAQILETAAECALPAGELLKLARKKCHGYPEKLVRSFIQQLIKDKELRKYPSFGRESSPIGRTGHPASYAEAARRFKEKVDAKVRAESGSQGAAAPEIQKPDFAAAILETMHRLEPAGAAPVSVREVRAALPAVAKPDFDAAALALRTSQKVFLSRHDYPQSLLPEERQLLVDGQDGNFYVAITVRTE